MTNEEARAILEEVKTIDDSMYQYNPAYLEALDMAIEALKAEPCEEELDFVQPHKRIPVTLDLSKSCEDAVSREAALNALYALCDTGETFKDNPWRDNPHIDAVIETIEQLPSVTPKQRTGKWMKTPKKVMGEGFMWYCSECKGEVYEDTEVGYPRDKYCSYCGAKMEGESKC